MNPLFFPKPLALHHVSSDQIVRGSTKWGKKVKPPNEPSIFPMRLALHHVGGDQIWRGSTQNRKEGEYLYLLIKSYSKLSWPKRTKWQLSLLYFSVVTCLFVLFNIHLLHFYPSHRCNINIHLLSFYPYHRCNIFVIIFFSCCILILKENTIQMK